MAEMFHIPQVLSYLQLEPDMRVAEFGCGAGFFSVALAGRLPRGIVYAIDIQNHRIERLKSDMRHLGMFHVKAQCRNVEVFGGSGLERDSLDAAVIPNALFQSENQHGMMQEAARVLKKGGQLLVVEWVKRNPLRMAMTSANPLEIKKTAELLNLRLRREFHAGDYHVGMIFEKI
ncbi:MAG: class I SAM-dependent methyltransferase [Candidatus Saccharimonadales bacterium]